LTYIMKAPNTKCFRCGKEIDTPNSSNADYVIADDAIDDGVQKTAIICPDCYRDTDKVIWGVHGNKASNEAERQLNAYSARMETFRGWMDDSANSIELMLNIILEGIKIKLGKKETLRSKIGKFEKSQETLESKYTGDFGKLVERLNKFNENWVITKHGMTSGGQKDLTIYKDGKFHIFDRRKQDEIEREFTEIMGALTEIWNGM